MIYCNNCGQSSLDQHKFCSKCGRAIEPNFGRVRPNLGFAFNIPLWSWIISFASRNVGLSAVVVALVALFMRVIAIYVLTPSISNDMVAYYALENAAESEDLQTAIEYEDQADNSASDPEIQTVATSFKGIYQVYIEIGITTKSESEDMDGELKAVLAGLSNLASGLFKSAKLLYYAWGLKDHINNLDNPAPD
jgi:hypothetical protein